MPRALPVVEIEHSPAVPQILEQGSVNIELLQEHNLLGSLIERILVKELIKDVHLPEERCNQLVAGFIAQNRRHENQSLEDIAQEKAMSTQQLKTQILAPAQLQAVADQRFSGKAESRFLAQKAQLDRMVYSLLRVESQSMAQELFLKIHSNESGFAELARRFSQGEERNTNGIIGPVPANQCHPRLAEKLRSAKPGQLLEPFRIDRWWLIARLERFGAASFDQRMASQMAMELLQEWLKDETQRSLQMIADRPATHTSSR